MYELLPYLLSGLMNFKPLSRSWFIIAASLGIGIVASTSIVGLNQWSHNSHQLVLSLAKVFKSLKGQSAVEWEAMAKQSFDDETQEELSETREEISGLLSTFSRQGSPENIELKDFINLYGQYSAALDEQFKLINAGEIEQAEVIDEERVDPLFDQMSDKIQRLSAQYQQHANTTSFLSDLGTIVSLLIASGTIGGLSYRFGTKILSQNNQLSAALQQIKGTQAHLVQQ